MMAAKPLVGGGKGWERDVEAMLRAVGGYTHRHEPKMAGRRRVAGGAPDYEIVLFGCPHFIECKHESDSSMDLGRLVGKDDEAGAGVKPSQAREMDAATAAGARCWIAVRLEVPESTRRRAAQMALYGEGRDMPATIRRLVSWTLWRARMVAAEEARRTGGDVVASIPAVELAGLGWPLRSAAELRAALMDNHMGNSGAAS